MARHTFTDGENLTASKVNNNLRAPEVRTGQFTLNYPSSATTAATATVTFSSPMSGVPHQITYIARNNTYGNIAINNDLTGKTANGFTIRGYRGGSGNITYDYTAVYYFGGDA